MLPTALAPTQGAQLVVVDYDAQVFTTLAATGGICSITTDAVDPGYYWLIERMSSQCTSTSPTILTVYAGNRMMDGSSSGNFDFADEQSPILLKSTEQLTATWTGCSAGAVGTLAVQWQLVARTS